MSRLTNLDDWETDPDFVRDMDEMDQRWGGSKRSIGSINMNKLMDDVRRDHQMMRDKFQHPSQMSRLTSDFSGDKFRSQHDGLETAKHSTQEISRKIVTSEKIVKETSESVSDAKKTILEKSSKSSTLEKSQYPPIAPKIGLNDYKPNRTSEMPSAFKSIQDKIDAFRREFDDIENKVTKKSDLTKVITRATTTNNTELPKVYDENVKYVTRSNETLGKSNNDTTNSRMNASKLSSSSSRLNAPSPSATRSTSTSPSQQNYYDNVPKTSIKSLSKRFESLGRESSDDFRRNIETKRKEFFDEIKSQVRETRKGLDGFDNIDSDDEHGNSQNCNKSSINSSKTNSYFATKESSSNQAFTPSKYTTSNLKTYSPSSILQQQQHKSSKLSNDSLNSSHSKPKVYTKRETTSEQVVSTFVKENDKVIHDETKRNVQRTSSCHGSSDEDDSLHRVHSPTSIKLIDQELRRSPQQRAKSPIEEIKKKVPFVDPEIKGAGLMARTLYDYTATEDDELSFDIDDLITNIEKVDKGWYKGCITYKDGRKQVGLFPANYVKLLNDSITSSLGMQANIRVATAIDAEKLCNLIARSTANKSTISAADLKRDLSKPSEFNESFRYDEDKVIEFDQNLVHSNNPICGAFVAETGEKFVGYIIFHYFYTPWRGHLAFIDDIFVVSEHRMQGIATQLIKQLSEYSKTSNLSSLLFNANNIESEILTKCKQHGISIVRDSNSDWSVYRIRFEPHCHKL